MEASWLVALAVKGSEEDALAAANDYGRLDQFPNREPLRFSVTNETPEALAILKRHPFYPKRSPLEFIYSDEGDEDLVPVITGKETE